MHTDVQSHTNIPLSIIQCYYRCLKVHVLILTFIIIIIIIIIMFISEKFIFNLILLWIGNQISWLDEAQTNVVLCTRVERLWTAGQYDEREKLTVQDSWQWVHRSVDRSNTVQAKFKVKALNNCNPFAAIRNKLTDMMTRQIQCNVSRIVLTQSIKV